jgi:hypothetical protein
MAFTWAFIMTNALLATVGKDNLQVRALSCTHVAQVCQQQYNIKVPRISEAPAACAYAHVAH